MGFGGDRRGQSVQIGAVLLFGVLILSLTTYQATVVPQENEQVEFNHNQRVQTDMLQLRDGVLGAAGSGTARPVTVEMGTRYPARAFLVNPGPPSGSLRTVDLGGSSEITVSNAEAIDDEAADYWTGDPADARSYPTRGIDYTPNYNEFASAPTTAYENTVVYNRAPSEAGGGVVARSDQTLVDGRTLNLVALQGELDTAAVESVSVSPRGDSAPARTVAVQPDGGPVVLEIPTRLSQSTWEDLLAEERQSNGGYITTIDVNSNTLTLELQETEAGNPVTYNLRLAGVSVGSGPVSTSAKYAVAVEGDETSIPEGGSQKLVVEVRDKYNNRVSGMSLNPSITKAAGGSGEEATPGSVVTDEDGYAEFVYEAPDNVDGNQDVDVTVGFGGDPEQRVVFDLSVMDSDGSGGSDSNPSPGQSSPDITAQTITDESSSGMGKNPDKYKISVDLSDSDDDLQRVEFVLQNSNGVQLDSGTDSSIGGGSASSTETLSSGGGKNNKDSEYIIKVTVYDSQDNKSSEQTIVSGSG